MVSEIEKKLYNTYLAVSRLSNNKPFTIRKNFDDFEKSKDYIYLKKVSLFLSQFPQIKPDIYFKAPYMLYPNTDHISLKFFATQKAIKTYTIYIKQLQEESPDSEHHIQFIKDSLRFIGMFCIKHKIPIEEYITYSCGSTFSWMTHIREHNICIYSLFEFPNLFGIIGSTPKDELDLFLGSLLTHLAGYKNKYDTSKRARKLVKEGLTRIKKVVNKDL